jgi:hypothetical protein
LAWLAWGCSQDAPPPVAAYDPSLRGQPLRSAPSAPGGASSAPTADDAPKQRGAAAQSVWIEIDVADLSNWDYDEGSGEIPPEILDWNGDKLAVHGFMNPTKFDKQGVIEFMLTAIPGACCFGSIPRLNEWVVVRLPAGKSAEYSYYAPIVVRGELEVGELVKEGAVLSLFRMEAQDIAAGE